MNGPVAQEAVVTAQVVVRDKDGNVKYEGPLVFTQITLEKPHGDDAQHRGS